MKLRHLAIAACVSLSPSLVFAIGAIAVDDRIGEKEPGYGFAIGYSNKEDAMRRAVEECHKAGNYNCKAKVWFAGCGAYAASRKYFGIGWGEHKDIAINKALRECGSEHCAIRVVKCDKPASTGRLKE